MEEIKTPEVVTNIHENIVKPMAQSVGEKLPINWTKRTWIIFGVIVTFGLVSGYALFAYKTTGTIRLGGKDIQVVKTPTEEGVKDASTFRDTATGQVVENDGKITNEGTHVLARGDASQNVYMTSSVIDLSKYVGKKVQVWGETFKGQKAGWLMDVGRIKIVN